MRLWKKISIYFIYPGCMLALGLFAGLSVQEFFYPNRQQSRQEETAESRETETNVSLEAAGGQEQVITADTRYVVERFDLTDSSRTEKRSRFRSSISE